MTSGGGLASLIPSRYRHPFYKVEYWSTGYKSGYNRERVPPEDADVVSSEVIDHDGHHSVMLDIDHHAVLIPSSTPGHFHLYMDVVIPWRKYRRLLKLMAQCGIIEPNYYRASVKRKSTHLRVPWKPKPKAKRY